MDDMSRNNAEELCALLEDRGGKDVIGLALGPKCSWASYLLVATATSRVHIQGLAAAAVEFAQGKGIEMRGKIKRSDDANWQIIDGGDIVISLMSDEARSFYGLEELWFEAERINPDTTASATP